MYPLSRIIIVIVQEVHTPDFIISSKSNVIKKIRASQIYFREGICYISGAYKKLARDLQRFKSDRIRKKMQYDKYNKPKQFTINKLQFFYRSTKIKLLSMLAQIIINKLYFFIRTKKLLKGQGSNQW